ncbi:hypothetical protein EDD18DRAFT_1358940 [Armillaria luteobubalina]|uniref:F-box domain-containing protein n=1 Tax=Armillaria luteobubalina TaxID=153913 RepID=A0AA39PTU8_9AGAR|nr:hypothetical protein EDD18DRAFT_1358940 [Armillaria luteobubalina]
MHLFKRKLKFKLTLLALFWKLKHRGKPCPVSLLTLPNELLQEIAYFLCKHDQKALHSICRRVDVALSTTVLSAILINITLPFSDHGQEILEYISRQPAGYVHELRICIWGSHAEHHAPTDVAEGDNRKDAPRSSRSHLETKANSNAFRDLYNRVLASMNNLQAMTLCISNGAQKAPPFFYQDTFNSLMKLPMIDLHLTHPEFTLPYFSHLSQFRNICRFSLIGYQNNSTPTIKKTLTRVLLNNHRLSYLFLHLVDRWDRRPTSLTISGIEHVFPRESAITLHHLSLKQCAINSAPHIFQHLHSLKSLQISNFDLYDTSSGFWIELARQGIHIPSITLKSQSVPSAVIDYLVSNEGMVELTFEVETDRGNVSNHWTIGRLPEYAVGVSQCSNLCVLGIVVEGNKDFTYPVLSLLKALLDLQTLRLVAHTNDFTPVIKRIECIRNDEPLLMRLQVVVSISYLGCIKFVLGLSTMRSKQV